MSNVLSFILLPCALQGREEGRGYLSWWLHFLFLGFQKFNIVRVWISLFFNLAEFSAIFEPCLLQNLGQFSAAVFWTRLSLSPFLQSMLFFNNANVLCFGSASPFSQPFPHAFSALLFRFYSLYWSSVTLTDSLCCSVHSAIERMIPSELLNWNDVVFTSKFPSPPSFCLIFFFSGA